MKVFSIRLCVVVLALVLGLILPTLADERACSETDLFVSDYSRSQTQFLTWISNPTEETLTGVYTVTAVFDQTQVTLDIVLEIEPNSTVIVDIDYTLPFFLIETELCGPGRPASEVPDPIVVRVR